MERPRAYDESQRFPSPISLSEDCQGESHCKLLTLVKQASSRFGDRNISGEASVVVLAYFCREVLKQILCIIFKFSFDYVDHSTTVRL